MLSTFYNVIAPIALITIVAFFIGKRFTIDTRSLSRIIIYLLTPALIFDSLTKSTIELAELGQLVGVSAVAMLGITAIGWGVTRVLRLNKRTSAVFTLAVALANSGNFGVPLVSFAFGEDGLSRGIIVFLSLSILYNTTGVFLAASGSVSTKAALFNVLKVPSPYALLIAIVVNVTAVTVPVPIERGLALMGQGALPLMIVVLGLQLAKTQLQSQLQLVGLACILRTVVAPLLTFTLVSLLPITDLNADILILLTAMPTAVTTIVLAEEFGSDVSFLSSTVLISTLTSFVTLSVLLALLT